MSKVIENVELLTDGGINPETGIHEEKLWQFHFVDCSEPRIMGRSKVLEYLTKGTVPPKTVHSFKKWDLTTTGGSKIRTWVVVYDDKSHVQLTNKDFYSLVTNGHKVEEEQKTKEEHSSPPVDSPRGQVAAAIKQAQEINPPFQEPRATTTEEEKEEIDNFRNQIKEEKSFLEEVRKDYYANPKATGLVDFK
jgi:myosin-crossreactive antigen